MDININTHTHTYISRVCSQIFFEGILLRKIFDVAMYI